jgi:ankyrin repeat protein
LIFFLITHLFAEDEHAAFIKAIQLGNVDQMEVYLKQGMKIDELSKIGATPLIYAIWGSHTHVVQLLIEYGAEVNLETERFGSPLSIATQVGNITNCQSLLDAGASIESPGKDGNTVLMEAIYNQHPHLMKFYIENGADVNKVGPAGRTALMFASMIGDSISVHHLLEAHADPNIATDIGETPLQRATALGFEKIIKMLKDAGTKPLAPDKPQE